MWKWFVILLGFSTPAMAEPVRFSCALDLRETKFPVRIVADEAYNLASVFLPSTDRMVVRPALFGPSQIIIDDEDQTWHLDRKTLRLRREVMVDNTLISDDGGCSVADKPKSSVP